MEYAPKDTIDMEKTVTFITLGEAAEGAIEAGKDQQERLEEFTQRVGSGEFHVETDGRLPCGCVDGRPGGKIRPNAAGGTETIFVADDLTTKRLAATDGSTCGGYRNMLQVLKDEGFEVGGHTDDHAQGGASGCGANDKLDKIYDFTVRKADVLRATTEMLGVSVDENTHAMIVANASSREDFSKGSELLAALRDTAGEEAVDPLRGSHKEVLAVINKRSGTTLDRDALEAEFGPDYEAFNVDVWTFDEAARATSLTQEEIDQKIVAMNYYNLATAFVLGGPNLRVVVLD